MKANRYTYYDDRQAYTDEEINHEDDGGYEEDMTGKLYWKPVVNNEKPFDKRLKWILQEEGMINRQLTARDIPFLKGVRAARQDIEDDVEILIAALEKFGIVELFLEENIESPT